MCDALNTTAWTPPPQPARRRRLKINEIDSQWHCAIIGTCLPLADLKALAAKMAITVAPGPSGYNLHASMIRLASSHHGVAKALTKKLDQRHFAALNRFSKVDNDAELIAIWTRCFEKGDVAGASWAVMSHPAASEETRTRVFRDIHMLSHQMGATARADLRQIDHLETERNELKARIDQQQDHFAAELSRREAENADLRRMLTNAEAEARKIARAAEDLAEMRTLHETNADLRAQLADAIDRHQESEKNRKTAAGALALLKQRLAHLAAENAELTEEIRIHETRLADGLARKDDVGGCEWDCAKLDLCGRCILFVGGRHQQMTHLRRLVEDCNGVFSHHDGGVEESMSRLHGLFGRADAVLFPVDCVSHSAQDAVKQLCQRWQKPFVPVRRSGLAAYLAALETVVMDG